MNNIFMHVLFFSSFIFIAHFFHGLCMIPGIFSLFMRSLLYAECWLSDRVCIHIYVGELLIKFSLNPWRNEGVIR